MATGGIPRKTFAGAVREAGEYMDARAGHVVVVDDDSINRALLTRSLELEGHRVTAVADGFAALNAIREDPPDVVLLDIVMPGLDGIEVLERMKSDADLRHVPVVMISGVDDDESIVRCIEIGADDFLPQPFDPAILRAPIETVDHADRAVAAARDMCGPRLAAFNGWLRSEGVSDGLSMGIGLNSGRVMSGTLGSERRFDYAVIGDTTNTAARIQDLTKE